jgi:trans-aconitate methyltransferase
MIYEDPTLYERQALPEEFYTATLEAIIDKYKVKTAIDYGCGLGVDVAMMLDAGLDVVGLDGSEEMREHVLFDSSRYRVGDLTEILEGEADLIWCREVAEHLPPEHAERLVENIACNCRVAYFTAAPPGQVGHQHVNPQPRQFWIDLFWAHGFDLDEDLTALNAKHPNPDDRMNGMVLA